MVPQGLLAAAAPTSDRVYLRVSECLPVPRA